MEFALNTVRSHFNANSNEAIKSLIEKTNTEESIASEGLGAKSYG